MNALEFWDAGATITIFVSEWSISLPLAEPLTSETSPSRKQGSRKGRVKATVDYDKGLRIVMAMLWSRRHLTAIPNKD